MSNWSTTIELVGGLANNSTQFGIGYEDVPISDINRVVSNESGGNWNNSGTIEINADFTTMYADFSPVPVPAAVWLFGSGLLGLIGVARRRKA